MGLPSGAGAFIGLTIIAIILLCILIGILGIFGKKWDWFARYNYDGVGVLDNTTLL